MKTTDLKKVKISAWMNGSNPPFELEIYVRVIIFVNGVTDEQLAKKKELEENIKKQLSKNLRLSSSSIADFIVENNAEPYQVKIDIDFIFAIPNLERNVFDEANDLIYKSLKSFQANAINLN
jgi:hypothetical protein